MEWCCCQQRPPLPGSNLCSICQQRPRAVASVSQDSRPTSVTHTRVNHVQRVACGAILCCLALVFGLGILVGWVARGMGN